jgi:hypothetical protein
LIDVRDKDSSILDGGELKEASMELKRLSEE